MAIRRPVTVVVGVILVVLFGVSAILSLPVQLTPDLMVPTLTVRTEWPGASPEDIEREILVPQENALKRLTGLVEMTSSAQPDSGTITLELELGVDIDEALVRATNRLQEVGEYPEGARSPSLETSDSSGPPLGVIAIRRIDGGSVAAYRTWVEDAIVPEIQRIAGVGDVRFIGGRDSVMRVDFDPTALASRGLRVTDLAARVRGELSDVSGGDVEIGRRRLLVRTMAVEPDPEAFEAIVLGAGDDGHPIRLGDVARVHRGLREPSGVAMSDDRPSLILLLTREAGSNVLEVTDAVRATVDRLDRDRFAAEGMRMEVLSDQVEYIRGALHLVRDNLLMGATLAILVLFLFLRSVGASAIISVAIPVSVFGTALGMPALGRSINVVSLAGITFAIGMVLDNSIVVIESIDTWRRKLGDAREAALRGAQEVWGAILASTATTAAVFIPVIAWQDEVGQLLKDVAVAVSLAVIVSFLVSVLVIPSLAAKLPSKAVASVSGGDEDPARASLFHRGRAWVASLAARLARAPGRALAVVASAVTFCIALAFLLLPPLEYLPIGNRNLIFGMLVPPPGTSVSDLEEVGYRVLGRMQREQGRDGVPAVERSFFVGTPDRLVSGAVAEDPAQLQALLAYLRGLQSSIPGYFSFTSQASIFGRVSGGRTIEVRFSGADLGDLVGAAGAMLGRVREVLPGAQVRPEPSLDPGAPELRFRPRRDQTAVLGMTTDELGLTVDAIIDGAFVGELAPPGQPTIDVLLSARVEGALLEDPDRVAAVPVVTPLGEVVPLATLAEAHEELGPTEIQRIERRRAITLEVGPPESVPLESALQLIRAELGEVAEAGLLSGVQVDIAGTAGDLEVAKVRFAEVLLMALLISYLLLAALFEDWLAPLVVLVTLPLGAAGGVVALRLVDAVLAPQPLDLMTALGFLILIGTVVNNAILVVDGALTRLAAGSPLETAIEEAVAGRVRPIMMTTMTSLAGLTPMVVSPGSGSELYRGIGAVVLGGLALSTVLTLVVVPSLFSLVHRLRARLGI